MPDEIDQVGPAGDDQAEPDLRDELMAVLLAAGHTHEQVAEECGVSTKTVQRRLGNPEFASLVARRRRVRITAITSVLVRSADDAVAVIRGAMHSEDERVSLQAARWIAESGRRFHREDVREGEFADRLQNVERRIAERLDGVELEHEGE